MSAKLLQQRAQNGQGLVEYALILALVSVVVVVVLAMFGSTLTRAYCRVVNVLGTAPAACALDVVRITNADYDAGDHEVHIDATSNGNYNPQATLTASPGGALANKGDHYDITVSLSGCPCTVVVTSSQGGTDSVTVGP